jgi:hypothetical protein
MCRLRQSDVAKQRVSAHFRKFQSEHFRKFQSEWSIYFLKTCHTTIVKLISAGVWDRSKIILSSSIGRTKFLRQIIGTLERKSIPTASIQSHWRKQCAFMRLCASLVWPTAVKWNLLDFYWAFDWFFPHQFSARFGEMKKNNWREPTDDETQGVTK